MIQSHTTIILLYCIHSTMHEKWQLNEANDTDQNADCRNVLVGSRIKWSRFHCFFSKTIKNAFDRNKTRNLFINIVSRAHALISIHFYLVHFWSNRSGSHWPFFWHMFDGRTWLRFISISQEHTFYPSVGQTVIHRIYFFIWNVCYSFVIWRTDFTNKTINQQIKRIK